MHTRFFGQQSIRLWYVLILLCLFVLNSIPVPLVQAQVASAKTTVLNMDGDLDITFGTDGKVTTDFNNSIDYGWAVDLQLDGKIEPRFSSFTLILLIL